MHANEYIIFKTIKVQIKITTLTKLPDLVIIIELFWTYIIPQESSNNVFTYYIWIWIQ